MVKSPPRMDEAAPWKRAAALAAVDEVESGMLVGLGTGSTMAFAIEALGQRASAGLRIATIATSRATKLAANAAGLKMLDFEGLDRVDLAIDGADEIDGRLRAIKGAGGAMLREKIVASAAQRMIVVVDASKQVATLGARPLPVEILPFAAGFVTCRIVELGASVSQRMAGGTFFCTDQGNAVLDCRFDAIQQPEILASALSAIPGVLEHGLFLDEIDAVYVGRAAGTLLLTRDSHRQDSGMECALPHRVDPPAGPSSSESTPGRRSTK